jgi:hypothetical protein
MHPSMWQSLWSWGTDNVKIMVHCEVT